MSSLEDGFQRMRWSPTRKSIAGMNPGDVVIFKDTERFNATTTIQRLKDAWPDRRWRSETVVNGILIERTA